MSSALNMPNVAIDIMYGPFPKKSLNNRDYKVVFTRPASYHSIPCKLSKPRFTRSLLFILIGRYRRMQLKLEKKFGVGYFLPPKHGYWRLFFGNGPYIISIATFMYFRPATFPLRLDAMQ